MSSRSLRSIPHNLSLGRFFGALNSQNGLTLHGAMPKGVTLNQGTLDSPTAIIDDIKNLNTHIKQGNSGSLARD